MKTKIVYVLVSQESDYYYEMLLLSHYSLRLYHPKGDTEVVLVMDTDTYQRLDDKKAPILDDVTPVKVEIPSEYTIMQRSRYLKTSLRQRVKGNFLYLDCDTIIYSSLNDVDSFDMEIAMISDLNDKLHYMNNNDITYCKRAGFTDLEGEPYYNGGVIYVPDTQKAIDFFTEWHRLWEISVRNGESRDQPSLCKANKILRHPIIEIPAEWNSMNVSIGNLTKTKIRHYLHYSGRRMALKLILDYIKATHSVDDIDAVISHPHTICESVLGISDERLINYLCTEQFYIYSCSYKRYQRLSFLFNSLSKLYYVLYKIKLFFHS